MRVAVPSFGKEPSQGSPVWETSEGQGGKSGDLGSVFRPDPPLGKGREDPV